MKVLCLALFIVQCSCSKSKNDLRIPSVAELTSGGLSIGNIGGNQNGGGGELTIGNIANILQTNIGSSGSQEGNEGTGSVGNIATILQTNIGALLNNLNDMGISDYRQWLNYNNNNSNNNNNTNNNNNNSNNNNNNGGEESQLNIGNIASILQSNIGSQEGIGNIANILQNNINIAQQNNNNYNSYIDDEKYIERPCQVFDIHCIRKYFAEHSKCQIVYGPVPDPKYRAQYTAMIPRVNITISGHGSLYKGLNGRIEEFYINKESDKLVMTIEFRNLTHYTKDAYFRYYRRGREPIVTVDYLYINYQYVITTIVIPNRKNLQLEKSETTSFVDVPAYSIGRNVFKSRDPQNRMALRMLLADVGTDVQEGQVTESPFYSATFIQENICDFGLKIL